MDTISISTLATLAGKWQAEADAHVTSPSTYGTARRETLRECADVLRGLCDSCECPPARAEFVTLGGGLPGDPNGACRAGRRRAGAQVRRRHAARDLARGAE